MAASDLFFFIVHLPHNFVKSRFGFFQKHISDILEERRLTAGAEAEPQRQDALADWFHPFDAEVTNAVFQSMQSGWNEWKRQLAEGKKRGDELKKNIEDSLEEFYDIFL